MPQENSQQRNINLLALDIAELRTELETSEDIIATLDNRRLEVVRGLLSSELNTVANFLTSRIQLAQKGTFLLDSDGTGHLVIDLGDETATQKFYDQMVQEQRVLPGRAISGEVAQDYTRVYRISPAMLQVAKRLTAHHVSLGIFSGRKEEDLRSTYGTALDSVEGFTIHPSKGRAIVTSEGSMLLPSFVEALADDPLRKVGETMNEKVLSLLPSEISEQARLLDYSDKDSGYEQLTGYRISVQPLRTPNGNQVVGLIRLHHRYQACKYAAEAGCNIPNIDAPGKVNGEALSAWLNSGEPRANQVIDRLNNEDKIIKTAWLETLGQERYYALNISTKDKVGHKSLCQDQAPEADPNEVIAQIEETSPVLLYAGDNWKKTKEEVGNDRVMMDALHERNTYTQLIAVSKDGESKGKEEYMVGATQETLFLLQYIVERELTQASKAA